ncbi:MAG: DNA mismatch repair protein MutS [Gammaproteobacteria bacterium]|nr:MAG: DNA mismatch repair protein MutS [Gammaproteobacteria bacterium]
MPKKTKISQEDLTTFHDAMKGVKLLTSDKIPLTSSKSRQKSIKSPPTAQKEEVFYFSDAHDLPPVSGETAISYKHKSLSDKMLRKLRKGQYNVEATLDLHGMSVEEAKIAMDQFLQQCLQHEIRVVLIIHGKGHHSQMPVLKNKLNHWLRTLDVILAFCSAAPLHGSRGATYVLLKRMTEEKLS